MTPFNHNRIALVALLSPIIAAGVVGWLEGGASRAYAQQLTGNTPIVTTAGPAASMVAKSLPGSQLSVYATNTTSVAGFLVGYNASAIPADGALTASLVLECVPLLATPGFASVNDQPGPTTNYTAGIVYFLTSASTCFTKTTTGGLVGFMKAKVQ